MHEGLPKLIVLVPDDDIITSLPYDADNNKPLVEQYEYILNSLMTMIDRIIATYKDWLPAKAKRELVPHILWIAPPTHKFFSDSNNEKRAKFTNAMANVVTLHQNTSMLRLVKCWDHNDSNLFLEQQYRYTNEGLKVNWRSVDAAIRFWGIAIAKKFEKKSLKDKKQIDESEATPKSRQIITISQSNDRRPSKNSYHDRHDNRHEYGSRNQYFKNKTTILTTAETIIDHMIIMITTILVTSGTTETTTKQVEDCHIKLWYILEQFYLGVSLCK